MKQMAVENNMGSVPMGVAMYPMCPFQMPNVPSLHFFRPCMGYKVDDPFRIRPPMSQYIATYFSESACGILEWAAFSVDAPDSSVCKLWHDSDS